MYVVLLVSVCLNGLASGKFTSSSLPSLSVPFRSSRWLSNSSRKKNSNDDDNHRMHGGEEGMSTARKAASLRMSTLVNLCGGGGDEGSEGTEPKVKGLCVGIDLGTTYSCVAVWKNGRVEICPNEQGNRITPSYVAWSDGQRLIGDAAKNQASSNPQNTVFDVKRLIGRKFTDSSVQKDQKLMPFKMTNKYDRLTDFFFYYDY